MLKPSPMTPQMALEYVYAMAKTHYERKAVRVLEAEMERLAREVLTLRTELTKPRNDAE
jgi:hypothetical protein